MYALVSCTSRYARRSRLVVVATDVHGTVAIKRGMLQLAVLHTLVEAAGASQVRGGGRLTLVPTFRGAAPYPILYIDEYGWFDNRGAHCGWLY